MISRASICGPLGSSFTCGAANQTCVVFSLSDTSTFASISGLDRAPCKSAHSMSFHNGALLTESHNGYDSSLDQFHLPKFSLVAREARPNSSVIRYISWGLTVEGMFVSVVMFVSVEDSLEVKQGAEWGKMLGRKGQPNFGCNLFVSPSHPPSISKLKLPK